MKWKELAILTMLLFFALYYTASFVYALNTGIEKNAEERREKPVFIFKKREDEMEEDNA